jgi:hypothetical protein
LGEVGATKEEDKAIITTFTLMKSTSSWINSQMEGSLSKRAVTFLENLNFKTEILGKRELKLTGTAHLRSTSGAILLETLLKREHQLIISSTRTIFITLFEALTTMMK